MIKFYKLFLTLTVGLATTACGFQLRGQNSDAQTLHSVALSGDKSISIALQQKMQKQLAVHDVTDDPQADFHLVLNQFEITKRRVASSRTSFNDRYLIRYTLSATLSNNALTDKPQWPLSTYSERLFDDNQNTPSAKSREESSIKKELEAKVIYDLSDQVRSFKASTSPINNSPSTAH